MMGAAPQGQVNQLVEQVFRHQAGQLLATLVRGKRPSSESEEYAC